MKFTKYEIYWPCPIMANIWQQFQVALIVNFSWVTSKIRGSFVSELLRASWHSARLGTLFSFFKLQRSLFLKNIIGTQIKIVLLENPFCTFFEFIPQPEWKMSIFDPPLFLQRLATFQQLCHHAKGLFNVKIPLY